MVYEGAYAAVLVLHLLTAVLVVGPLAVTSTHASRLVREGRVEALRTASRTVRGSALASVVVVVLGTAMVGLGDVGGQWEFSQVWISASYALWLVALAITLLLVVRGLDDAVDALGPGGPGSGGATASRVAAGGGLAMLCWIAIVVLMVVKPGA